MRECRHWWLRYPPLIGRLRTCVRCGALRAGEHTVTLAGNHAELTVAAAPANPAAGLVRVYAPTATSLRMRDSAGAETDLAATGSGHSSWLSFVRANRAYIAGHLGIGSGTSGSHTITANQLYAVPFYVPAAKTANLIGVNVSTAVAGNLRLGIYNSTSDLYPNALQLDAGVVATGTTGAKTITISQALSAGLHWLAFVADAGPAVYATVLEYCWGVLGSATDNFSGEGNKGHIWRVAFTYAVLPATFTAGASIILAENTPRIAISFA